MAWAARCTALSPLPQTLLMVMAATFESLVHPFIVLFTLPLALIGVVAAPLLVSVFAFGWVMDGETEKLALAAEMLRLTFPYLFFISMTAFAGGIQARHAGRTITLELFFYEACRDDFDNAIKKTLRNQSVHSLVAYALGMEKIPMISFFEKQFFHILGALIAEAYFRNGDGGIRKL